MLLYWLLYRLVFTTERPTLLAAASSTTPWRSDAFLDEGFFDDFLGSGFFDDPRGEEPWSRPAT